MQQIPHDKTYLLDFSRVQMREYMVALGLEKYRADQIFKAIYSQQLDDFSGFTTLSKKLRQQLDETSLLRALTLTKTTESNSDGTTKFLWQLRDGKSIESVIIYEGKRVTFCISSQVGCALDCKFCATGKMGFLRNLTTGEIVEQVLKMNALAKSPATNIVFMGMGEPLLNLRHVLEASHILSDPEGLAFARKRITLSTSGVAPAIRRIADQDVPFMLAVSLNAVFEEKRREIMPISEKYPLPELFDALRYYVRKTKKRVTFEYVLIGGINDSKKDADQLLRLTAQLPCKINLIPCNSTDPAFPPPPQEQVHWFTEYINENRRTATIRLRKGWEIQAACGQLYSDNNNQIGAKIRFGEIKVLSQTTGQ